MLRFTGSEQMVFLKRHRVLIDRSTIQRIMDAADIVDVVGQFVTLRKSGVNYKGLCPFHDEKTPSFIVSPSKQLFKCFSCGEGGNVVGFIMKHEQMTYPEALKWLGRKYGVEVREKELTDEEKAAETERESMYVLNEWARDWFVNVLHNEVDGIAIGMAYFRSRGFRDDTIKKFQLGFSPSNRTALATAAVKKGFNPEYLVKTGLCFEAENDGKLLDRYHDRVIFPVHTISGRIVAFGGRILGDKQKNVGKYVNSPESVIYSKSHELYGLYFARQAISKQDCCYLVEGYTDVISMHQSGVENVVASSGTSLTEGQIRLLHRFTSNITVIYDGDSAGIKASLRGIDMLLAEGMQIKVLLLPDGDDPDSFARKHTADDFRKYIKENEVDFIRFKTKLLLNEIGDDPLKRAGLITDVVRSISVIPDGIVRQAFVKECASLLDVNEQLILNEIGKNRAVLRKQLAEKQQTNQEGPDDVPPPTASEVEGADISELIAAQNTNSYDEQERMIATLIVKYGASKIMVNIDEDRTEEMTVAQYVAENLSADGIVFRHPVYKQILEEAANFDNSGSLSMFDYFVTHENPDIASFANRAVNDELPLTESLRQGLVKDENRLDELTPLLINNLKYAILKDEVAALRRQLLRPEIKNDFKAQMQILQQIKELGTITEMFAKALTRVLIK